MGDCLVKAPSYGINAPAVPRTDKLPAYVRITDINDDGRLASAQLPSVDNPHSVQYELSVGDIVLARTGASVGKSWLYDGSVKPLVYAGFLIKVTPNQQRLMPSFLAAYLTTGTYWNWVNQTSMRSGQPGINGVEYSQLLVPVPPLPEQRAIATALSDVDALIAGLERLIAKKRDIKQAAMQQLLTGQTRLPGFSGEWEVKRLGQLGAFLKGSGVKRDQALSGELPCIRYGEIYTLHNDVVRKFHSRISQGLAATATRIQLGDLLFAGSGETKAEIGKCVAMALPVDAYAGGDIVILRLRSGDPSFFGYLLNTPAVVRQKSNLGQGDAVVHISAAALSSIEVQVPTVHEQTAIATVLSDIDADLAALESRLAKTRAIKQGMMQELLTGRTRLV